MKKTFTSLKQLFMLAALFICGTPLANAQAVGDIVFTGYDTKGTATTDFFTFVVLTPLPAGTTINFTDRGYGGSSYNADNGSSESTIRWISGTSILPIGTEVKIMGLTAAILNENNTLPAGSVTALTGTLGLSLTGLDQVIAYTGTLNTNAVAIAGIHWNNCSGNTTTANWDIVGTCATVTGVSGSTMPPGLSNSNAAMWAGLTGGVARICGKFKCPTTKYGSTSDLRTAIMNNDNWTFITTTSETLAVGNSCTYLSSGPAISAQPSDANVCAGTGTSFSITSATATSYKWYVKIGSGNFTEIPNAGVYSGATTATLTMSSVPASANGYIYRAEAINSSGTTTSNQAVLNVANGVPTIGANPSAAAICPGGNTILSASATGGTVTYKWQVNTGSGFADITDGGIYSNSSTGSLTITGAPTSMYGFQYRLTATNTCGTSYSNAAVLTFISTWTGTNSTNWNIGANWSCNVVPDAQTDVVIGTATNQPTVSTVANVRNVTLNTGGTLTIAAANTLSLTGSINSAGGTLNATAINATVNFNSTDSNQPIAGGTYFNVQFTGAGNKVLAGDVFVNGSANILTNQLVFLGNNTLTIGAAGSVSANSLRYFVTNGTGGLKKMGITSTSFVYPVGTTTSYTPFLVNNSGGTSDNFTGRVIDGLYNNYIGSVPVGAPNTVNGVNKTWFLTEDVAGGSNIQMIVQWNQSDELANFVRTSLNFAQYTNGSWNPMTTQGASPSTGAGPYTATRAGINSLGPFGIFTSTVLPIKLLSFKAKPESNAVRLDWATESESNNRSFTILRSADGENFTTIGNVDGSGTSSTKKSYVFHDRSPLSGTSYFKLIQTDYDGTPTEVGIRDVIFSLNGEIILYPNPATSEITVKLEAQSDKIELLDMSGRVIQKAKVGPGTATHTFNTVGLPPGTYFVRLYDAKGFTVLKFVKI